MTQTANVQCKCNQAASQMTVRKEGPNQGRAFFSCGNNRACNFFDWADGPPSGSNTTQSKGVEKSSMS